MFVVSKKIAFHFFGKLKVHDWKTKYDDIIGGVFNTENDFYLHVIQLRRSPLIF